jgi:hypothetical protein
VAKRPERTDDMAEDGPPSGEMAPTNDKEGFFHLVVRNGSTLLAQYHPQRGFVQNSPIKRRGYPPSQFETVEMAGRVAPLLFVVLVRPLSFSCRCVIGCTEATWWFEKGGNKM